MFDATRTLLSRNSVIARTLASIHLAAREAGVASSMTEDFGKYRAVAKEASLEPTAQMVLSWFIAFTGTVLFG